MTQLLEFVVLGEKQTKHQIKDVKEQSAFEN